MPTFTLRKVYNQEFALVFDNIWISHVHYFLIHMHTCYELHILGQKALFLWFFDKKYFFLAV